MAQEHFVVNRVSGSRTTFTLIWPLRSSELTSQYQNLDGTAFQGSGIVVVFPLSVLADDSELRVGVGA